MIAVSSATTFCLVTDLYFFARGVHQNHNCRAYWTASTDTSCALYDALKPSATVLRTTTAAATVSGQFLEATFTLNSTTSTTTAAPTTTTAAALTAAAAYRKLCYGFAGEPLVLYPGISVQIVPPFAAYTPSTAVGGAFYAVQNAPTDFKLTGTFGLTTGNELKLVPGGSLNCSVPAAGGQLQLLEPVSTTVSASVLAAAAGSAVYTLQLSEVNAGSRPYAVCLRFGRGESTPWTLFETIRVAVTTVSSATITVISTAAAATTVERGAPAVPVTASFVFSGSALSTGDAAKFVDASVLSDSDCAAAAAIGGSAVASVTASSSGDSSSASMQFTAVAPPWSLCYRHSNAGKRWRLYSDLSVTSSLEQRARQQREAGGVVAGAASATQKTVVTAAVKTTGTLPDSTAARALLATAFIADISTALACDPSRIQVCCCLCKLDVC
jgi:hypothetical protein